MRKKYLSALLFGALLFASAGTFTSCKDYDDDIDNLQSQIDKVVSDLASLKSIVDNLNVGVTSVTVDGDQLVVVTNGATTKMNLPVGVQVSEIEIKNGHLYVGGVDKGAIDAPATPTEKAQKVEVKEDGFLYIDDVKQDGLHVGTDVVIKDASNGIYTITIGKETIQLPMASAAIQSLTAKGATDYMQGTYVVFSQKYLTGSASYNATGYGIYWGKAGSAIDNWTGTLGAIAKDQTLIGQINQNKVKVSPATFDLSKVTLTLVDTKGNVAPAVVSVSPVSSDYPSTSGSRAANTGEWNLAVKLTAEADKLGSAYAANGENILYALAADGVVLSDYNIIIDTRNTAAQLPGWSAAMATNKLYVGTGAVAISTPGGQPQGTIATLALGNHKIVYKDAQCADVQVDINASSIDDAELLGITLDKTTNTLKVSEKAANVNNKPIMLDVKLLSYDGQVSEKTAHITINAFGTISDTEDKVTLATTTYTVTPAANKDVIVNMEDVFSGLTAAQSTDLTATWTVDANDKFLLASGNITSSIKYYASEQDAKDQANAININDATAGSRVRNIKYARITVGSYDSNAKKGTHNLALTLNTSQGVLKKVTVPVDVVLPAFTDLFDTTDKWTDGVCNIRLTASAANVPAFNITPMFTAKNANVTVSSIKIGIDKKSDGTAIMSTQSGTIVPLVAAAIKDNNSNLAVKEIKVTASYNLGGADFVVKSDKFTANLKSIFEGAELVFFTDGVAGDEATITNGNEIAAYVPETSSTKASGLAVKFGSAYAQVAGAIGGLTFNASSSNGVTVVKYEPAVPALPNVTATVSSGKVVLAGLNPDDQSTLIVTFTDFAGIKTSASIKFK